MQTVPLDKKRHQRKRFDCGVEALNNYLKLMANQHASKDNSRTYVLEDPKDESIIAGFYTLAMVTVNLSALPEHLQNRHYSNHTAGLIARLAVDKRYTKRGIGSWLLVDGLKKLLVASDMVGFPMVAVDAKEGVSSFYEQFGFQPFYEEKERLFMPVADIRTSFGNGIKNIH
ncbi:GNAT family N-acetyltransferase [Hydrogenimonas sp.]